VVRRLQDDFVDLVDGVLDFEVGVGRRNLDLEHETVDFANDDRDLDVLRN